MSRPSFPLDRAVVAITGGGRGIGLAIARRLAAEGARIAIGDLDAALASQAAQSLGGFGSRLDVRSRASFDAFIAATEAALGPVDVLVNNAGIMPMGAFTEEPDALSDAQIDINLRGVIHGCKAVLPSMQARGRGRIVNIASLAGVVGIPGAAIYCATKFAVRGLTISLREELRDSGISVGAVLPSKVLTELSSGTSGAAGRNVPTVTPEQVAEATLALLQGDLAEVTAPRYLKPTAPLLAAVPHWLERRFRRFVNDHRLLDQLDRRERAAYQQRLDALTAERQPERVA